MVHAFQSVVVSLYIILALQFSSVPAVGFRLFRVKNHSSVCHHRSETPPHRFSKPIYPSLRTTPLFTTLEYLDDSNMNSVLFFPSEGRPRSALVDACAVWCGPCKLIEPFLAKCGESFESLIRRKANKMRDNHLSSPPNLMFSSTSNK